MKALSQQFLSATGMLRSLWCPCSVPAGPGSASAAATETELLQELWVGSCAAHRAATRWTCRPRSRNHSGRHERASQSGERCGSQSACGSTLTGLPPLTCGAALPRGTGAVLRLPLQAGLEARTATSTCAHKYICTHSHFPAP